MPVMSPGDTITNVEESDDTCIPFNCPVCGQKLKVEADFGTFEVACPACQSLIMTPAVGIGPGIRLDEFILKRRIGRGAMGDVYEAEQRSLGRTVAVKILAPAWGSNPEMSARFQREVKTLARLEHPNIVKAFSAGQCRGVHYLAMHYVKGGTLQEMIKERGRMSEVEALSVIYKVADALRYAWKEEGIIHRDIKPANIMIEPDGEIKLTDLGISKCIYEDESMTHGHRVFGTPLYMSPEQARGELNLDFRSDQYSLGVTLYHMLAGCPPFNAKDVQDVIRLHGDATPPLITESRPDLSRACIACLHRMLARYPDRRYSSWSWLLRDVGAILSDLGTQETTLGPPALKYPNPPLRLRKRRGRFAFVVVVLAGILVLGSQLVFRDQSRWSSISQELRVAKSQITGMAFRMRNACTAYINKRKERQKTAQQVAVLMYDLNQRAALLVIRGMTNEAIALYRDYDGPMTAETKAERRRRMAEIMIPDS